MCPARNYSLTWVVKILLLLLTSLLSIHSKYQRADKTIVNDSVHQWNHPTCDCSRHFQIDPAAGELANRNNLHLSTCGPAADVRGPKQRVLSFSFFGDTKSNYFEGIARNAKVISKLYPGWIMRVYHDIFQKDGKLKLCDVVCLHPNLDDCDVLKLDNKFQNISRKFGMIWRFAAMADPLVDVTLSRDLDSTVYRREVDAVSEWLTSNKTWHMMRDHPLHKIKMLGGLWGVKNSVNRSEMASHFDRLLESAINDDYVYGKDQSMLDELIAPQASQSMLTHDSFSCQLFNDSSPFPTRRNKMTFVGDYGSWQINETCPHVCRPPDHQDWLYC